MTTVVAHTKKATGLYTLSAPSRLLRVSSTEKVVAIKILPSSPEFQKYHVGNTIRIRLFPDSREFLKFLKIVYDHRKREFIFSC